jgi:hypothetical protein
MCYVAEIRQHFGPSVMCYVATIQTRTVIFYSLDVGVGPYSAGILFTLHTWAWLISFSAAVILFHLAV